MKTIQEMRKALQSRIVEAEDAIAALDLVEQAFAEPAEPGKSIQTTSHGNRLSPDGRARIAEAQRKRWAAYREAKGALASPSLPAPTHGTSVRG